MKLHKKITFGLLALTLVGPMTSCSDFLDEELTTQQNTDFFDTQEGIDRLEVSLYYNLRFHFAKEWACATTNYGTDLMLPGIIMMETSSHRLSATLPICMKFGMACISVSTMPICY